MENKLHLTLAESILLSFLEQHKGIEFSMEEIERYTNLPAVEVKRIAENLDWKGYNVRVAKRRNKVYFINKTLTSEVVIGLFIAFVIFVGYYAFIR